MLGSKTALTSLVKAATVPPTTPDFTTNDFGTLAAPGSTAAFVAFTFDPQSPVQGRERGGKGCKDVSLASKETGEGSSKLLTWVLVFFLLDPFLGMLS